MHLGFFYSFWQSAHTVYASHAYARISVPSSVHGLRGRVLRQSTEVHLKTKAAWAAVECIIFSCIIIFCSLCLHRHDRDISF